MLHGVPRGARPDALQFAVNIVESRKREGDCEMNTRNLMQTLLCSVFLLTAGMIPAYAADEEKSYIDHEVV